ncbi:hypothetical protein JW824_04915 [bacterium]|nr:hypothetical protein [bacterium]RQV92922.1 MAG: hypothetical protein EH221_10625 [bacterium]
MKKTVSKFSILFIFAILIPGSVLTYFSIQNISNQRELTEKRLQEEQNQLATDLSELFQKNLLMYANSFFQDVDRFSSSPIKAMPFLNSTEFVLQAFVVDQAGQFLWPNYHEAGKAIQEAEKANAFLEIYSSAETMEFVQVGLNEALQLYQEALNTAESGQENASATNAMARVMVKLKLFNKALTEYRTLVDQYGFVIDESGIPFGYYALDQLIRISSQHFDERILIDIDHILTKIIQGEIPITSYADLFMENFDGWYESLPPDRVQNDLNLYDKIDQMRRFLQFISQDENTIKRFLAENQPHSTPTLGPFNTIIGSHQDQPYLIVLDDKPMLPARVGIKVNLNYMKTVLLNAIQESLPEYDLTVEVVSPNQSLPADVGSFHIIRDLSPYTPFWRLWIQPRNPNTITQYISKQRWIYGIAITLLIAGMFFGVVLVLRDVSREEKLAQLRSDFISNVTHELKTPLTSIRMFAETMRLGRIKKKNIRQEYLSVIVSESERLTRLINTVLDFSKIEQGEKQYQIVPVNLSLIVEKALAAMNYWLKEHGFLVRADIQPDIHLTADGDAMEQVVLNLVSNAMKYSPDLKEISVRLWQKAGFIHLEVQDRGLGIPESKQSHIFDKYYRAHAEHEKDKGGSGLGLTVVKHIVDAHRGRIELKSKVNEGSTFTIILPEIQNALPKEKDMG